MSLNIPRSNKSVGSPPHIVDCTSISVNLVTVQM